jgi:hypothetical protein
MDAFLCTVLVLSCGATPATTYRTPNFVVTAPTAEFARQVGDAAEYYRRELATEWTGQVMRNWSAPCPIQVHVGPMGAGGATTFQFDRGEVFGWNMRIQGTPERILDSVLPHEINHTIFACYFRQPLPRWADEGAASLIEHESERARLKKIHEEVVGKPRQIPLRQLLSMKNYPQDERQVLVLYAEGYSLADFLVQQSSKPRYLQFLSAALTHGWEPAFEQYYGYQRLEQLEEDLNRWVLAGSPPLRPKHGNLLAGSEVARPQSAVIRAQSPEPLLVLGEPAPWPKPAEPRTVAAPSRSRASLLLPIASMADGAARQSRATLTHP